MKDKIINEILSLEKGTKFTLREIFSKVNIEPTIPMSLDIVKILGDNIEPAVKAKDGRMPVTGLPCDFPYIKK